MKLEAYPGPKGLARLSLEAQGEQEQNILLGVASLLAEGAWKALSGVIGRAADIQDVVEPGDMVTLDDGTDLRVAAIDSEGHIVAEEV